MGYHAVIGQIKKSAAPQANTIFDAGMREA
jgi:hypothetical protein